METLSRVRTCIRGFLSIFCLIELALKVFCSDDNVILTFTILVKQLSREFTRAGADIVQAYSFYGSDSKLEVSGVQYDVSYH